MAGGDQVAWEVDDREGQVTFYVTTTSRSHWASIAIGRRMAGSHAYVAWVDDDQAGHLRSYRMTGESASSVNKVRGRGHPAPQRPAPARLL